MKKITFIINGRLKKKDQLKNNISRNFSGQFEINYLITKAPGDAIRLGQNAIKEQADYLVVIGGDGTINEVVNGYMNTDKTLRENTAIGTLPYGTGNDIARTFGLRKDVEQLAQFIENDQTQSIDVGEVQYISEEGENRTRYFINITDIGIGAHVVKIINKGSRIFGPSLTYHLAILQSFLTYKHIRVRLTSDSFNWQGPVLCLCMANSRSFGGGLYIAPQANISDGQIQLVIFGNLSMIDYIKNMSRVKRGEILEHPEILYKKVRSCHIEPLEGECPIDMDGEFIGYAPLDMKVHEGALKFLKENN